MRSVHAEEGGVVGEEEEAVVEREHLKGESMGRVGQVGQMGQMGNNRRCDSMGNHRRCDKWGPSWERDKWAARCGSVTSGRESGWSETWLFRLFFSKHRDGRLGLGGRVGGRGGAQADEERHDAVEAVELLRRGGESPYHLGPRVDPTSPREQPTDSHFEKMRV